MSRFFLTAACLCVIMIGVKINAILKVILMIKKYHTACRGCHGGCILELSFEDERLVGASPFDGPLNKNRACGKGMTIVEQTYHPDRLLYPLKRTGGRGEGKWEKISWDEAYEEISDRLSDIIEKHGAKAISTVTGTGRHLNSHLMRFGHALGTPNNMSNGAFICLGPRRTSAIYTSGVFSGADYYGDVPPAGMVVWGSSPDTSGPDGELQWHIKKMVQKKVPMLVIDPYPGFLPKNASIWLRIRPGTDGALALGIINIIIEKGLYDKEFVKEWSFGFDELKKRARQYDTKTVSKITLIPEEDILRAAVFMSKTRPLSLEWGPAMEQSVNAFQSCRAIFCLMGLLGNYDVPGGLIESSEIAPPADPRFDLVPKENMDLAIGRGWGRFGPPFGHPYAILDAMKNANPYRIRALFAHATNSLLCMADSKHTYECLMELEFFVCMDIFMTPTAELADIVLPAALWPEVNCLFGMPEFADHALLRQKKLHQTGEAKSDEAFFIELSRKMGIDYGADSEEEILNDILSEMGRRRPEYDDLTFDAFPEEGFIAPKRQYFKYRQRGGFNTPSKKFEFYSNEAEKDGLDPLPFWKEVPESPVSRPDLKDKYPLILTTGKRIQNFFLSNNRQVRSMRRSRPFPLASLSPGAAEKYGISEGEWIFIETMRGKITQKAHITPELSDNVIHCEVGWWYPEDPSPLHGAFESNVNVLTIGAPPYDEMGAYQLRALLCRISKNPDGIKIEERYYASKYYAGLKPSKMGKYITYDPMKCDLCGECVAACPKGLFFIRSIGEDTLVVMKDEGSCIGCRACVRKCANESLSYG